MSYLAAIGITFSVWLLFIFSPYWLGDVWFVRMFRARPDGCDGDYAISGALPVSHDEDRITILPDITVSTMIVDRLVRDLRERDDRLSHGAADEIVSLRNQLHVSKLARKRLLGTLERIVNRASSEAEYERSIG